MQLNLQMQTKITWGLTLTVHKYISLQYAQLSIVSIFAYFCAFVLLSCQHEEKHERKKSVQKLDEMEFRKKDD